MSETLAQTYRDNIRIEGDTAVRMTFSRNGRVAQEGLRLRAFRSGRPSSKSPHGRH